MSSIITVTGEIVEVTPASGFYFTLEELQGMVGGYIELVARGVNGEWIFVNEDGKRKGLPVNNIGTQYVHRRRPDLSYDTIVGPVLVVEKKHTKEHQN